MANKITESADQRMSKSVQALNQALQKIRTGRAHPDLLEHIKISYYGTDTPLNQVANVNVLDASTLGISPWDKAIISDIEKAIVSSDLGLNPVTQGDILRVPLPSLTEERRKELVRVVKTEGEKARVAIRNIRRDANQTSKDQVSDKQLTEDEERKVIDQIQKMTDQYISEIDKLLAHKEQEVMAL